MSKIEVDAITEQSGSTLTAGGGAGKTVVVDATTVTLGRCGGTVALASGASQTGFGRTGTVDWQTGSIKTATFTAANGEGYFCNTSGGAFTVNLPAGSAGAIISVSDYTRTFQTHNLTINPNGSEKIGGIAQDAILETEGQTATFVYVDGTEGWINTQETSNSITGKPPFVVATGGTITTSGNDKIHTFTGPGTFAVTNLSPTPANNEVSYVVLAGGAGGGSSAIGGGGGAGGFREDKSPITPYTASPLDGAGPITVTLSSFPIVVGGGGAKGPANGSNPSGVDGASGSVSTFSTITSAGGGGGSSRPGTAGTAGASGGGGQGDGSSAAGGTGNQPPTSPAQGTAGGAARTVPGCRGGGGGGGATVAGGNGQPPYHGGDGGAGATTSISGSPLAYAGGGGGGGGRCTEASGGDPGSSIGGRGGANPGSPQGKNGGDAIASRGSGGGGGGTCGGTGAGGNGSGGTVIIRYKFQ